MTHRSDPRLVTGSRLGEDAKQFCRAPLRVRVAHLERDEPLVPDVSREVHDGHTAAPELLLERVAVGQSIFEMVYGAGQCEVLAGATRLA